MQFVRIKVDPQSSMTGVLIKRAQFGDRDRYTHRENPTNMKIETVVAIV